MDRFYDFTRCEPSLKQFGGSDTKRSVFFNKNRYMLKFPDRIEEEKRNEMNTTYRNNVFSEYVSCHIIETLGLPVQETLLGKYEDDKISEHIVVACKDFCEEGYELNEFEDYKSSPDIEFKSKKYPEIGDVCNAIQEYTKSLSKDAIERFWDTFAVDALLGNFDRHTGNWGYLFNDAAEKDKIKLAPIYDCGSCLYPMLSDKGMENVLSSEELINERIYEFPKAAFNDNEKQIAYFDFLTSDAIEQYPEIKKSVEKICESYDRNKIIQVLQNTPQISEIRKYFYETMIEARKDKILIPARERCNCRSILSVAPDKRIEDAKRRSASIKQPDPVEPANRQTYEGHDER